MKMKHRNAHRLIWLLLTPILIATLIIGYQVRPEDPINVVLPEALTEE